MMSSKGVGTSVPSSSIKKNGTKVPTPKGYKQTKVGVIPEDWEEVQLSSFINKKIVYCNDENINLGSLTIKNGVIPKPVQYNREHLVKDTNNAYKLVEQNNFAYNPMNLRFGALALYQNPQQLKVSAYYNIFTIDSAIVDIDYIYAYLKSERIMFYYNRMATGSLEEKKRVHFKEFKKFVFPLPPLKEQQKIAQILTTWDDAIIKQEALIKTKEELKKGLMQRLLSGEVRFEEFGAETLVSSSSMEKNGTEVPAPKWEILELSNIFDIASKKLNPKLSIENKKCIELEHIEQKSGKLLGYTDSEEQQSTKNIFQEGQILYGKLRPYLRKYWKAEFDGVCSSEIWVLNNSKKITNEYLFYFIQTEKFNQIANVSSGSKMPRSDWKYMAEIPFDIPPLKEQQKIAQVLTLADKEIDLLKTELEALKEQKRGLMQGLLSGGVRVKV